MESAFDRYREAKFDSIKIKAPENLIHRVKGLNHYLFKHTFCAIKVNSF